MFLAIDLFLLALFSPPLISAFNNITLGSKIYANQDFTIHLNNDFASGIESYDREYDSFRTFLSADHTDGEFALYCYLLNSSTMGVPMITTNIPSNIGERGSFYRIEVQAFNQDPNNRTVNNSSQGIMQSSNSFDLEGTAGKWTEFENDGEIIGYPGSIPCEAYDCVRTCYQVYYPRNPNTGHSGKPCDMIPAWDCFRGCPSTSFPSWEETDYGRGCLAAQAASSSQAAANPKTFSSLSSTSTVSSVSGSTGSSGVVFTQASTETTSPSASTTARKTSGSGSGRLSDPTDTSMGATRATAVPSLASSEKSPIDLLTFLGSGLLGLWVVNGC